MTNYPGSGDEPADPYQSPGQQGYGVPGQQPQYNQPVYGGQPPAYGQPPTYPQPGYGYPMSAPNDGQATAALVLGILGLVVAPCYGVGLIMSPIAWILGHLSMKRIDAANGHLGGRGMAQAGLIMGIIGTVLLALAIIAVIVIVIVIASSSSSSDSF